MYLANEIQGAAGIIPELNKAMVKEKVMLPQDQKDKIETTISKQNEYIELPLRTNSKFEFHEKLNDYYLTVIDPMTNETLKEIPPKQLLDMYAEMAEFMGILIDEKI